MLYFTSDQHFGHENIVKYCARPYTSAEEMDADLIERWNSVVGLSDIVYQLADFSLGNKHQVIKYISQLNGRIRLLSTPWHHDRFWLPMDKDVRQAGGRWPYYALAPQFVTASGYALELLPPMTTLDIDELGAGDHPLAIVLCHYPIAMWDRKHYGSWHLHGHEHQRVQESGYVLDVGVDVNDYTPVSLDQVIEQMKARGWQQEPTRPTSR